MMLEYRVQAHHGHVFFGKQMMNAFRLRYPVFDAARTQHLKCMQNDYPTAQLLKTEGALNVKPLTDLPGGRDSGFLWFVHSPSLGVLNT